MRQPFRKGVFVKQKHIHLNDRMPADQEQALVHLRIKSVINIVPVSERTWLRWVEEGNAPAPVRLGKMSVAWKLMDIQAWLAARPVAGSAS